MASDKPKPSQPVFHSHSLRFRVCPVCLEGAQARPDGPGTKTMATTKTVMAGKRRERTARTAVEIFSWVWGKEIDGSTRVKGRWLGVILQKPAPTAAMALNYAAQLIDLHRRG